MAPQTVLLEPPAERIPIRDAPRHTLTSVRTEPSRVERAVKTSRNRRTFRQILAAALASAVRYTSKYGHYRSLGYTRDAAIRKARWHVR